MKKKIVWLLAVVLLLCGCSGSEQILETRKEEKIEGLRIVYEICDETYTEEEMEDCL